MDRVLKVGQTISGSAGAGTTEEKGRDRQGVWGVSLNWRHGGGFWSPGLSTHLHPDSASGALGLMMAPMSDLHSFAAPPQIRRTEVVRANAR